MPWRNWCASLLVLVFALLPAQASAAMRNAAAREAIAQAQTLLEAGQTDQAITFLLQLQAEDPDNADVHSLLGYGYRQLKKYEQAQTHYARALSLQPEHEGALEYLGELYLQTGDTAGVQRMMNRLEALCIRGQCKGRDLLATAIAGTPATGKAW